MHMKDIIKYKNHPHIVILSNNKNFNIFEYTKYKENTIMNLNIEYSNSSNHFFFNMNLFKKNFIHYKKFINQLINTNITNNLIYLYFYNYNDISSNVQLYVKYIMEHVFHVKIIIISSRFSRINDSIKNQCYHIKHNHVNQLAMKYNDTIINILYQLYIYNDFYKFVIKLRLFIKNTYLHDMDIDDIIYCLINRILNKSYITYGAKYKLLKIISVLEHKLHISYNKLIIYEYIFIKIYKIIKYSINIYYN